RDSEIKWAKDFLHDLGMSSFSPVAFNTGSGDRWKTKRWPMESFLELGLMLREDAGGRILLVGGPIEDEANSLLATERPDLFVYPGVLELRRFIALLSRTRLIVTADTMALHIGLGLQVPTVALFGSTSAPEIEAAGPLEKVVSPVDCICCYLKECDKQPFCMDVLTPEMVAKRIEEANWLTQPSMKD
ncbi:MAG: glycosyltransferase family 9 protein, partial [Candidatus Omnitrophica bacterium]|nr:glycosyltransferase family 9 protein [Candidatus Omnitrophota bacterium]